MPQSNKMSLFCHWFPIKLLFDVTPRAHPYCMSLSEVAVWGREGEQANEIQLFLWERRLPSPHDQGFLSETAFSLPQNKARKSARVESGCQEEQKTISNHWVLWPSPRWCGCRRSTPAWSRLFQNPDWGRTGSVQGKRSVQAEIIWLIPLVWAHGWTSLLKLWRGRRRAVIKSHKASWAQGSERTQVKMTLCFPRFKTKEIPPPHIKHSSAQLSTPPGSRVAMPSNATEFPAEVPPSTP